MFAASRGRLDIFFSRTATTDELAAALGPMYAAMQAKASVVLKIAAVVFAPLTATAVWVAHFSQATPGIGA
jgi:hypothetical protein